MKEKVKQERKSRHNKIGEWDTLGPSLAIARGDVSAASVQYLLVKGLLLHLVSSVTSVGQAATVWNLATQHQGQVGAGEEPDSLG